jgi:hypothetical protein
VFGVKEVQAMMVPPPYQALWKLFNLLGVVVSEFCQGLIPISSVQHNAQETHRDAGETAGSVTVLDAITLDVSPQDIIEIISAKPL